jgi:hypothetical protein
MLFIPIVGIGISLIFYFYMKSIYRKVVPDVNKFTYMDYIEIHPFDLGNTRSKIIDYPAYLEKALKDMSNSEDEILVSQYNLNKFLYDRPPSLYEDIVFLGPTGLHLIHVFLQLSGFMLICWSVLILFKYLPAISAYYGKGMNWVLIITLLLYVFTYAYLLSLNLRWFTIISSVFMKFI